MNKVSNSIKLKLMWNRKRSSKIIYMDEIFITIGGRLYYLVVVVVDGSGHVLVWEFIRKRTAENIYKIISKAIDKLRYF
ncbi:MAG: hypothetical protein ACTSPQ_11110, partial [Candidatus Helarchaeota archaeon]